MRLTKKREKKINNVMNTKEDMTKCTSELQRYISYKLTSFLVRKI